jgi:hypothetical protein
MTKPENETDPQFLPTVLSPSRMLSERDRDALLALLEEDSEPNEALRNAAESYKLQLPALGGR